MNVNWISHTKVVYYESIKWKLKKLMKFGTMHMYYTRTLLVVLFLVCLCVCVSAYWDTRLCGPDCVCIYYYYYLCLTCCGIPLECIWAEGILGRLFLHGACVAWCMRSYTRLVHAGLLAWSSVFRKVRGWGEMDYGSMACCSRGQLVKHRYTIRLMFLYSSFSVLSRHVLGGG
jgi:hypothetical protein